MTTKQKDPLMHSNDTHSVAKRYPLRRQSTDLALDPICSSPPERKRSKINKTSAKGPIAREDNNPKPASPYDRSITGARIAQQGGTGHPLEYAAALDQECQQELNHVGAHHISSSADTTSSEGPNTTPAGVQDISLIIATTVPDIEVAIATIAETKVEEHFSSCYCCGVKCGAITRIGARDSHRRRRLYCILLASAIVIIALVAGLSSVFLATKSSDGASDEDAQQQVVTSLPPSTSPSTTAPTPAPSLVQTSRFFTTLTSTHEFFGHMFDITVKKSLDVIAMEIHLVSNSTETIEIWTKRGQYHTYETDKFQWAKIGQANVVGMGRNKLTALPLDLFDPVRVDAGVTQAFYVTARTRSIAFQEQTDPTTGTSLIDYGEVAYSDENLDLNVGTGVQYLFQNFALPNVFNGVLVFALTE